MDRALQDGVEPSSDGASGEDLTAGRSEAFDTLDARYVPRVRSLVDARVQTHADVEPIAPETVGFVSSPIDCTRWSSPLLPWIHGIASHPALDHARRSTPRRRRAAGVEAGGRVASRAVGAHPLRQPRSSSAWPTRAEGRA